MRLRKLAFQHPADKHDGQHPLARFGRAQHVDHVAPRVVAPEPKRLEAQHGFDRAPRTARAESRPPDRARARLRPALRQTPSAQQSGCATSAPVRDPRCRKKQPPGGTGCAGWRKRRAQSLGSKTKERHSSARPSPRSAAAVFRLEPRVPAPSKRRGRNRRLLPHLEIETVHRTGSGKTRRQPQYGERFQVVPSPNMASMAPARKRVTGCRSSRSSK